MSTGQDDGQQAQPSPNNAPSIVSPASTSSSARPELCRIPGEVKITSGTSDASSQIRKTSVEGTEEPKFTDMTPSIDKQELRNLRAAISKRFLSEQQRLAAISADSDTTGKRPSPIIEEPFSSPLTNSISGQPSSTDSAQTIRGGHAQSPMGQQALRTPSYPFPYVPGTPRVWSPAFHQPFTVLSPTTSTGPAPPPGNDSKSTYPNSMDMDADSFIPAGMTQNMLPNDPRYPTPNLYDAVLLLNAEPNLESWWNTLTKMLHDEYLADRVSLALPADANDIENVPWGQKATFNVLGQDEESPAKPAPQVFDEPPRMLRPVVLQTRPGLESRHSYSGLSLKDQNQRRPSPGVNDAAAPRPAMAARTLSHMPSLLRNETLLSSGRSSPAMAGQSIIMSDPAFSSLGGDRNFIPQTSVFDVLRGFETEEDSLIDASGVNRVLERGHMVTLTRDYVKEQNVTKEVKQQYTSVNERPAISKDNAPFRNLFSTSMEMNGKRRGSAFQEYEQHPPSPWSQSPAPSPAIQADPNENPFFTGLDTVEDSFDPPTASPDYTKLEAIEAIGVDKAHTVIHLPLIHPTLSGIMPSLGDESFSTSTRTSPTLNRADTVVTSRERRAPIAIISILTPAVPYPQNLTQSLKMLGPHLAASYSTAFQISAMQSQVWGFRQKRMGTNVIASHSNVQASSLDHLIRSDLDDNQTTTSGSITSPSDYSGRSRHSPTSSTAGTPGWEGQSRSVSGTPIATSAGLVEPSESYFDRKRGNVSRSLSSIVTPQRPDNMKPPPTIRKIGSTDEENRNEQRLRTLSSGKNADKSPLRLSTPKDVSPARSAEPISPRRTNFKAEGPIGPDNADRLHSVLHSYGADFSASFQNLPSSTTARPQSSSISGTAHRKSTSLDGHEMPPPSERLLRTIIDALPVQIFTAAPSTGELTWVNSKFMVYRGQDSRQVLKEPWESLHPEDRSLYTGQWHRSLRTGQQLQLKVRLQRFDGNYRWFYVRVAPLKDKRQNIVHWIGTNMDFHEQHIAEINAARQQETAASEAKYRALANSSPQVVFTIHRTKGITFCNSQWVTYSGQAEADALGLGFMEYVHPDDIVKCKLPTFDATGSNVADIPTSAPFTFNRSVSSSQGSSSGSSDTERGITSPYSPPTAQIPQRKLSELASTGILKVTRDADGRPSYSTEVRLRDKDGEYRWFLVRVLLADDNLRVNDDEETWYGTCTDINDHKALERDLKETMDEKSRFLSNMSHEIRTPLNGITGMVNFLIDSNLSEEQMEHVNIIRASTEGLRGLINDILDLSKAEAGMIALNMDWLYVRSLIEEVNDLTSAMAIDKGLELNYLVETDVPSQIKGDRFRIRQILLNVIGNAIKFTQTGEVFLRCSTWQHPEYPVKADEILIQFEIIDTGRGFTDKEAEYLFKRFSQIDGSSTRQHGGTGLGLVISRQLAHLHGGDMSAKGYPGKGATFVFFVKATLPTDANHPPIDTTIAVPIPTESSTRPATVGTSIEPKIQPRSLPPTLAHKVLQNSPLSSEVRMTESPQPSPAFSSPSISISSASSDPWIRTSKTSLQSESSSASSFFPDPSIPSRVDLELSMPLSRASSRESMISVDSLAPKNTNVVAVPPMFSILVVCPLRYSREATVKHIDMTLPKNIPHQITARGSLEEGEQMISGDEVILFTHVVLVLQSVTDIIAFVNHLMNSAPHAATQIVIITDFNQKRLIMQSASQYDYEQLASDRRLRFIFKPLKPSKFAFIFDPQKERELSTDRNQDSAQQVALTQKQLYDDMTKRLGNKGKRVLLVEDNRVNQMVCVKGCRMNQTDC